MGRHASERALINFPVLFAARERQTPMLEFINGGGRIAAEIFDSVLVAEPVRALDGVIHVPPPVILSHVAQRGRDPTLRGDRVRAGGEYLGDAGCAQARLTASNHRAQA
jgi:hypothetical protein